MERFERAVDDGARVVDLEESTLADITQQIIERQKAADNTLESSRKLLAKLHIYDSMTSIKLEGSARLDKTLIPEDFIVSLCEILRPNQAIVDEIDLEQDPFKGLLPTPNLDVFKSSASIALRALPDYLTEELMASSIEIRNRVVIAIATHSDPLADWFDKESAKVCDSVREIYAPHVESKDVLVEYILKSIVKPLFGKGPRTITEQGRKAMRVPQSRPEVFSFSDEKPWRKDKPEALSLLLFAIANLKHESIEQNWHLIVPPILTTLDEGDVLSKSHACGILERVITSVGSDFLNRTGLGSVFEEAISPCLHFLPPITPVNHSIKSFRAAVATSVALSKHRYLSSDEGMWYKALDKILRDGPFYGMTYAGENVSMVEVFLQETKTLVNLLGMRSVRHLSKLVPLCTAQLVSPFIMTHPKLAHQAAETLIEVIRNCWAKIPEYNAEILKGVVFCWMRIKDEDEDDISTAGGGASFISAYTTPGPKERATCAKKKANLGVMFGVYLPTIQHILGVTMFIRLFWVVGVAGVWHTMLLLFLCCTCTLLTCISLSAVATNGVVEGGGAYFMISRNLGAEFGSAVGILFYLANTVATSMYLVGGVEVFLLYIYPSLTIGGEEVHSDTGMLGMMSNNYRIYGTLLLLIECVIVALGVRFVQLLAPVSLLCVILSIMACFAGGIEKAITYNGQHVCMLEDHLLSSRVLNIPHHEDIANICDYCKKGDHIADEFCEGNATTEVCQTYTGGNLRCVNAFPGFNSLILTQNMDSVYLQAGQAILRERVADKAREVYQDVTTSFFLLLAIYFPAVTGIMTGANMSGDLKDPQRSIPSGTVAATLTTSFIYVALAILFGASIIGPVLRDKNGKSLDGSLVVASLSWPSPWVVIVGSFLSTFGAALQCLCSAPRLLQSIAKDNVIPMLSPFARVTKNNEPFLGLLITTFIAELAILLGAVDAIAEVLDFFFLMCYAFVNLICALHSLMGAPNWRPRFKYYHWSLSLAGAFLCFFIMFASCWYYALIACALTGTIYKYVEWKGAKQEWGDGLRGLALTTAQYSLMKVEDKDPHPKNWRPQLLILVDGKYSKEMIDLRSLNLLNLAGQLKAGKGLAITVAFVRCPATRGMHAENRKKAEEIKERVQQDMTQARLRGFGKALLYTETQIEGAVSALYQSIGIGGLRPNTVFLNFPRMGENQDQHTEQMIFAEQLCCGAQNDNCMVVVKGITDFPRPNDRLRGYLDIWWIVQDGGILMLIAYLLQQHKVWKGCKMRVYVISQTEEQNEEIKHALQRHIYMLRIDANVFIVNMIDPDSVDDDAVQKTLNMEQRTRTLLKKNLSNLSNGGMLNGGFLSDDSGRLTPQTRNSANNTLTVPGQQQIRQSIIETSFIQKTFEGMDNQDTLNSSDQISLKDIDDVKVQKMNAAVRLNQVILEYSTESQLVLLSLPKPPKSIQSLVENYLAYVEALTEGLPRIMLIGGSGKEVITADS